MYRLIFDESIQSFKENRWGIIKRLIFPMFWIAFWLNIPDMEKNVLISLTIYIPALLMTISDTINDLSISMAIYICPFDENDRKKYFYTKWIINFGVMFITFIPIAMILLLKNMLNIELVACNFILFVSFNIYLNLNLIKSKLDFDECQFGQGMEMLSIVVMIIMAIAILYHQTENMFMSKEWLIIFGLQIILDILMFISKIKAINILTNYENLASIREETSKEVNKKGIWN
ncbi:hypothetical protein [Intestinibacter sp.]